jgi:hypothetical protein
VLEFTVKHIQPGEDEARTQKLTQVGFRELIDQRGWGTVIHHVSVHG